jgi:hypothetical protein
MPEMTWSAELSRYYWKRWKGWMCWHAERPSFAPITRINPPNSSRPRSMTADPACHRRAFGGRSFHY